MISDTKTRILDTAESLFSEQGLAATSLRNIISKANVNLAAIHYHFRSKDALVEAVIGQRVAQVNRERLEMLDRAEAASDPPRVEAVVEAFIAPTVMLALHPDRGGRTFVRLMGRFLVEGGDKMPQVMQKHFGEVILRFRRALERALPQLPPEELVWRMYFTTGAMAHALRCGPELEVLGGGQCNPTDYRGVTDRLVRFLAAGFRAEHGA